jgi:hypothetical protein
MNYDITSHTRMSDTEQLPKAPASSFRKRPVKLAYDKNEYYTFRMPSEKDFLLGGFESQDLFGAKKGIQQSPHIKAQSDLDNNMLWMFGGLTILALFGEFKGKA